MALNIPFASEAKGEISPTPPRFAPRGRSVAQIEKRFVHNGLFIANVSHARQRPRRNAFSYGVYYLCFALDEMDRLKNSLLSLNRFNLFSFHERDYGARGAGSLDGWIRDLLKAWDVPQADGQIVLLTLPRLLGYVFNPVSFWFCLDKQGNLRAVLSEVSNTFGDRHCYLSFHDDRRPITQDDRISAQKMMHVSPFIAICGHYVFRFCYKDDKVGVWIDHHDEEGLLITTSVVGRRRPLTASGLLFCFFRYPLVTFRVIGLIHYQALRLWLKGVPYRTRPAPPSKEVSR
jgi:DUF1365 family protein